MPTRLLYPAAHHHPHRHRAEIDLVHLGVFLTVNLAIGQITPPVGATFTRQRLWATSAPGTIIKKITPFVVCGIAALLIITIFPQLTMVLVNLLKLMLKAAWPGQCRLCLT